MDQPIRSTTKDTLAHVTQERLDMLADTTPAQFDVVFDEIVAWMNVGILELGAGAIGCMLVPICEKAISSGPEEGEEAVRTYARLCGKLMEQVDLNVKDDNLNNSNGQRIVGAQVVRRYLTGWCREAVGRLWPVQEMEPSSSATSTAVDAGEDQAPTRGVEQDDHPTESLLSSSEDGSTAQTKSRRLRLVAFLCELFRLGAVAERPVHECIKEILCNAESAENPGEEEVESLCKLWTSIGQLLDTPKAAAHINVYVGHMAMLTKSPNISSRARLMLLNAIDLRERKWTSYDEAATLSMSNASSDLARKEAIAEKYTAEYAKLHARRLRPSRAAQDAPSSKSPQKPLRPSCDLPPVRLPPGHPRCGPIPISPPFSFIKPTSMSAAEPDDGGRRPSAVAIAHPIKDINSVQYPKGIKGPKPELNDVSQQGKFRYDLDFLLQFQDVCTMIPDWLLPI
ncbi:armadillo-type protein [Cubamyces menziesii]|nr:armadillo-type protein [Cubamyces menziesii]